MSPVLFAFGSNGSGQLGIGHVEDVSTPERCIFKDDFSCQSLDSGPPKKKISDNVSRIVAGGNHTLVLLDDGRVYIAGGRESVFKRVFVSDPETGTEYGLFKSVAATWEASVLVVSTAKESQDSRGDAVFVLGSGSKGELGLGAEVTEAQTTGARVPKFPPRNVEVLSVAGGMGHTVAVCSDGSVYGWGAARKGQLGAQLISEKIVWEPRQIDLEGISVNFAVSDAVCGREFTVLCGDKDKGEFAVLGPGSGSPGEKDKWSIQTGIPALESVKGYLRIHASWHGVYVHQKDQSICAWGRNDRGSARYLAKADPGSQDCPAAVRRTLLMKAKDGSYWISSCIPAEHILRLGLLVLSDIPLPIIIRRYKKTIKFGGRRLLRRNCSLCILLRASRGCPFVRELQRSAWTGVSRGYQDSGRLGADGDVDAVVGKISNCSAEGLKCTAISFRKAGSTVHSLVDCDRSKMACWTVVDSHVWIFTNLKLAAFNCSIFISSICPPGEDG
ncbi:hypothetical protein AN5934.2 [Aspergillus nidulans FGSC A4]|uniref:Alpha-tubulin suppressor protein Aats1, putative (AFU_orthologue AFUA_2G10700) n=1 Tax=Emericella nidulans (strain FGSC A4 / ATCC 38163 / CBS 112.46 / NRRL 194 / M139) TaxID=227321 RepID=Q5B0J6_EMENI|nr:hypothetical protein [Aspergillus nidulans FGSC A4]EAA57797.1 hypothetical protein AN5934.2 [Aspergillus nidulans FGSC A4]CBF70535.1 TPA: alpha-tubulin suppressor protein Aats1, putative (AFU_orthologue; AFUA_2G10700) [Aspergillus nidulans FGSC A4]|eukprot:XP_663538.1 hypothetical protein AN5934.2 [Aspergillus nidulans FGSC A4]